MLLPTMVDTLTNGGHGLGCAGFPAQEQIQEHQDARRGPGPARFEHLQEAEDSRCARGVPPPVQAGYRHYSHGL